MEQEIINKLYLELSQIAEAMTEDEIIMINTLRDIYKSNLQGPEVNILKERARDALENIKMFKLKMKYL